MTWIALVAGSSVGAPLRYLLEIWVTGLAARRRSRSFPWGLLVVNVLGSALAGIALAVTTGDLRVLLITGLCGAFTTFSGYAWVTDRVWQVSRPAFYASVAVMPTACVAAFMLAWTVSGRG